MDLPELKLQISATPSPEKVDTDELHVVASTLALRNTHTLRHKPQSDLASVSAVLGGGYYDVLGWNGATISRVFCVNTSTTLAVGDTVILRYYNSDPQHPYIRSTPGLYTVASEARVLIDINSNFLWAQTGGYWFTRYASLGVAKLLPLEGLSGTVIVAYVSGFSGYKAMQTLGVSLIPTSTGVVISYCQSTLVSPGGETVYIEVTENFIRSPSDPYFITVAHNIVDILSISVTTGGGGFECFGYVETNRVYPYKETLDASFDIMYSYLTVGLPGSYFPYFTVAADPVVPMDGLWVWEEDTVTVFVDSVQDTGAVVQINYPTGYQVILSATPAIGAFVEVVYTDATINSGSDHFSGTPAPPFTLTHPPIEGSVSCTAVDPEITLIIKDIYDIYPVYLPSVTLEVDITYTYADSQGELWDCESIRIDEVGVGGSTHSAIIIVPTPVTNMTPDIWWDYGRNFNGGLAQYDLGLWVLARYGVVAYSPRLNCYTVAHPSGLYHIARDGSYTRLPWPDDGFTDAFQSLRLGAMVPKRGGVPHCGVTLVDRFAFQGSWGRLCRGGGRVAIRGVGSLDTLGEPITDADFTLRIYLLVNGRWIIRAVLSPYALILGNAGTWDTYVLGAGITQYPTAIFGFNRPEWYRNTAWPATRHADSFIVACSWAEAEWTNDYRRPNNNKANYTAFTIGLHDAGLTICAVSNSGVVSSKYTIKCDPNYIEYDVSVGDLSDVVTQAIANGTAGLALTGQAFPIYNIYAAVADFGAFEVTSPNNKWFFYYYYTTAGAVKSPIKRYPGVPTLGNMLPVYGDADSIDQQTTYQEIILDADDYIYFCVAIPYWLRTRDTIQPEVSEYVYGEYNSGPFSTQGGWYTFIIPGYSGWDMISFVVDTDDDYPTLDGNRITVYQQAGHSTPFIRYANWLAIQLPITQDLQHYSNLRFTWAHEIPHRTYASLVDTNPPGYTLYFLPGYGPTFGLPFDGVARFALEGDTRMAFLNESRMFLYKMRHDPLTRNLHLVWSLGISQTKRLVPEHVNPNTARLPVSRFTKTHATRPVGRYIVVVRDHLIEAEVTIGGGVEIEVLGLVVDVYENLMVLPISYTHRIIVTPYIEPVLYSSWAGTPVNVTTHVGIDEDGYEWVYITGKRSGNGEFFRARVKLTETSYIVEYSTVTESLSYNGGQEWGISGYHNAYPDDTGRLFWHNTE